MHVWFECVLNTCNFPKASVVSTYEVYNGDKIKKDKNDGFRNYINLMPVIELRLVLLTQGLAGQAYWRDFKRICLPQMPSNHSDNKLCFRIKPDPIFAIFSKPYPIKQTKSTMRKLLMA